MDNRNDKVIAMFSASWCDACSDYRPKFEKLAEEYSNKDVLNFWGFEMIEEKKNYFTDDK